MDRTKLCIIDEAGNEFSASKRGVNQIWGSISKWFKEKNIKPGTKVKISYDKAESRNGAPVIRIEVQHGSLKTKKIDESGNEEIKEEFLNYLRTQTRIKLPSTHKQYVKWLDKVSVWLIDHKICARDFNIWKDVDQIPEIDNQLNGSYHEAWSDSNSDPKQNGWLSAPWGHWIKFNEWKSNGSPIRPRIILEEPTLEMKPFALTICKEDIASAGLFFSERTITRFVAALLTKPFVILTGLSGSGKTKLAQSFA
jgi:hypothetical protein